LHLELFTVPSHLATSYEPITTGAAKKVPPARAISAGFAEWAAVPLEA
jgi:hypothetical protein